MSDFYANVQAISDSIDRRDATIAALSRSNERQRDLIASVQSLCTKYLEPGGLTEDEFISRVIAQLDGPVQREIEAERDAALAKARGEQA